MKLPDKAVLPQTDGFIALFKSLIFPELSLTGHEPKLANELASTPDDPRFNVFHWTIRNDKSGFWHAGIFPLEG